jgi:hypothetical protein
MRRLVRPRRHEIIVFEFATPTRRHLALHNVGHTACGRRLVGMTFREEVIFPWTLVPVILPRCSTCLRVLNSGGLGFWVTSRGTLITHEDVMGLATEAERGYDVSRLLPLHSPRDEPGPDAMRWYPLKGDKKL